MRDLLRAVSVQRAVTDNVIVLFSGGKDSVVTLDLCRRYFPRVSMVFMYYVEGLSFQERIIRYYENLYGLDCIRVPHFELSNFLRYGVFRPFDTDVPIIGTRDVYNHIREQTGQYWIAGGERMADSIVRNAMIKHSGSIDTKRGRFYPLAEWSKADVLNYIKKYKLKVGEESKSLGFSFRSLEYKQLNIIRELYPNDYYIISEWFPLIEAEMKRGDSRVQENQV